MSGSLPRDVTCWYCARGQHARCPWPATCNCYTCYPIEPAAPDCGIAEPHAPGMHAPPIDLTEPDEEEGEPGPASYESCDEKEDEIFGEVGKRIAQRAAAARARILGRERYPALIVAAALASVGFTIYFFATGHRLLALLV